MYKYKTKNGGELVIPGVGHTENGEIVSQRKLFNANLEFVGEVNQASAPVQAHPQAAQGAVIGVAPQATATAPQPPVAPQPTPQPAPAPQPTNEEQKQ